MKKNKLYIFIIILIWVSILVGCNSEENKVRDLLSAIEEQLEEDNIDGAIQLYEEVFDVTNDSEYQERIEELKVQQEVQQEEQERLDNDIVIVNVTIDELRDVLFNPDGLQLNKAIIYRSDSWASVYIDYSGMNKMGGYSRDYAYSTFSNNVFNEGSFYPSFESNYKSAEKDLDDIKTYYFDLKLLENEN